MNNIFLYAGATVVFVWGVAHLIPTRSVVNGFGNISEDNKRIITMEWLMEGLALCFIGFLVLGVALVGPIAEPISKTVLWMCAGMLVVMAIVSLMTGARTAVSPMKLCPWIKTTVAVLLALGVLL